MKFGAIHILLYLGWLIPALIIFYGAAGRGRRKTMEKFAGPEVLDRVTLFYSRRMRRISAVLLIAAGAFLIIALARPQWGFYWKENKKKGIDIVIGIDTSKSMLAADVKPDRLSFVKAEVGEFIRLLQGDRVGLIAFSGSAFLQCPLTVDYRGYILALNSLGPITVSKGGTAISSAIKEAVRCYRGAESVHKIFILVSDGEHHEGDIDKAIELAEKEKIRIFCIGVGTPEGTMLYETDESGKTVPVKDADGKPVVTRLNEETLKKIASRTGGAYIRSVGTNFGLSGLYEQNLSKLEKRVSEGDKVKVYQEKYQYAAAVACILLVGEMIVRKKGNEEM